MHQAVELFPFRAVPSARAGAAYDLCQEIESRFLRMVKRTIEGLQRSPMLCLEAHIATSRIDAFSSVVRKMEINPVKKREGLEHE